MGAARVAGPHPAEQRPDAGRQLLGGERLGQVVVGTRLEARHDVVGVGAGRDHDDRDVGHPADGAADVEAVDAGQHDVDQHDVGRLALEGVERLLAGVGLLDRPALVLERQLDRGADALVVLDQQDPHAAARRRRTSHPWRFARSTTPTSMASSTVRRMIDSKSTHPSCPRRQRRSEARARVSLGQPLLTIRLVQARFLPAPSPWHDAARAALHGSHRGIEWGSHVASKIVEKTGPRMSENSLTPGKAIAIILSACSLIQPALAWRELAASPDTASELCKRVPLV